VVIAAAKLQYRKAMAADGDNRARLVLWECMSYAFGQSSFGWNSGEGHGPAPSTCGCSAIEVVPTDLCRQSLEATGGVFVVLDDASLTNFQATFTAVKLHHLDGLGSNIYSDKTLI
jgi:hypothetical protein